MARRLQEFPARLERDKVFLLPKWADHMATAVQIFLQEFLEYTRRVGGISQGLAP